MSKKGDCRIPAGKTTFTCNGSEYAQLLGLNSRFVVSVQTVDATPSGIELFSKVVFMRPGKRFGLSAEQKIDVWRRWKAGQTLHEIGRAFGKDHNSIRGVVARHGGIVPAVRRRALLALALREREEISRGLACGSSFREIAKCLGRAVSTVSREVARHGGRPAYRASQADGQAWQSALRPKRCLLSIHLNLRNMVASKLMLDWSPKQISGWLKTQYPDDESMRVSHETIYRSLFIQARGALKKELLEHLRSKRRIRRSRHSRIFKDGRAAKSRRPSRSAKGPRKWRTVPFRVTGRAISCAAQGTLTSRLWWNAIRALSC